MVKEKECISCGKKVTNDPSSVSFPCPNCLKVEIVRCKNCRERAIPYRCPECGFEGP